MNLTYPLSDIRRAASVILAASAKETFPDAMLVGGGVTSVGFYYDFVFPFAFQSSFLVLLEEGMVRIMKKSLSFAYKEMVPLCAADYLAHKGHGMRAKFVADLEDVLVTLVEFPGFIDMLDHSFSSVRTSDVGAIKLKAFEKIGKKEGRDVVRVFGVADRDKQRLKDFLKKEGDVVRRQHAVVGLQKKYFMPAADGALWIWLPKGVCLLHALQKMLKDQCAQSGYEKVILPSVDELAWAGQEDVVGKVEEGFFEERARLARLSNLGKVSEETVLLDANLDDFSCGLLKKYQSLFDVQYDFCGEKHLAEQCISSLQFIIKMLKILCFEFKIIFSVRKASQSSRHREEKVCGTALKEAIRSLGLSVEEKTHSTFKGAQVEFFIEDALERSWSVSLMRVSFLEKALPVVITSALGSRERLVALLIEQEKDEALLGSQ